MRYFFALLTVAIVAAACQKEITGAGGDGTTAPPATPSKKCTGCSYLPVCDSARLTYVDSTAAGTDTTTGTLAILADTVINGKKFNRVSPFAAFTQGLLYNCDGGSYTVYQAVPALGINIDSLFQSLGLPGGVALPSHIQTTVLKTSITAGGTWSDTVMQFTVVAPLKATVKIDYTLREKAVQRSVLGKPYSNVIHVASKLNIAVPLLPITLPFDISVDTWYADSVGIIETRVVNNGVVQSATKLLR